jgi:hypothetical protein
LLTGVTSVTVRAGTLSSTESPAAKLEALRQRQQQCVDRWNRQRMWFWSTGTFRVLVSAKPCGVVVGYVSQGRLGEYWPCSLNRLGGYACPETGFRKRPGQPAPPRRWNAKLRAGGPIVLDRPPSRRLANRWPVWMKLYRLANGYLVPFDASGNVRPGISVTGDGSLNVDCERTRAGADPRYLSCFTRVCFARTLPAPRDAFVACVNGGAGSTRFEWARLLAAVP